MACPVPRARAHSFFSNYLKRKKKNKKGREDRGEDTKEPTDLLGGLLERDSVLCARARVRARNRVTTKGAQR